MLASGEFDVREGLLELDVPVKVVGVKDLFPPVDLHAGLFCSLGCQQGRDVETVCAAHSDKGNGVGNIQTHVAIDLDGVVGSDSLLALPQVFDVLADTLVSVRRAVGKCDLGAPETQLLGNFRTGTSEV